MHDHPLAIELYPASKAEYELSFYSKPALAAALIRKALSVRKWLQHQSPPRKVSLQNFEGQMIHSERVVMYYPDSETFPGMHACLLLSCIYKNTNHPSGSPNDSLHGTSFT